MERKKNCYQSIIIYICILGITNPPSTTIRWIFIWWHFHKFNDSKWRWSKNGALNNIPCVYLPIVAEFCDFKITQHFVDITKFSLPFKADFGKIQHFWKKKLAHLKMITSYTPTTIPVNWALNLKHSLISTQFAILFNWK